MITRKIGFAIVAASSILIGIMITSACKEKKADNDEKQEIALANIMTRTSVRSYLDKAVEPEKIEKLLRAGMAAPSAMNKQPWHFVVLTEKADREKLASTNRRAQMILEAPLAIVVCGDMDKALEGTSRDYWIQDASAASQNILLAAHAMGLGAVWTGCYPTEERVKGVSEALSLPENLIPLNVIIIGYPDGENKPKDKWNEENVTYGPFKK